jgi:pimeloyl-ACP methyl ester carboxylesterase
MVKINRQLLIAALALALSIVLTACGGARNRTIEIGGAVQAVYTPPETYADHRTQQQTLRVDGGTIAYTDHGTGPAIVLLHGVPTSSWMYRKLIPLLQSDMRVITIDFLGYGSSDKPAGGADVYGEGAQAVRVHDLLDHLGVGEHALLMHDMGGLVAWEMLRTQPDAISHLVVLNTIVTPSGFNHPDIKPGAVTRQLVKAYTGQLTSVAILQNTFSSLGLTGEHTLSEAECFGYVAPMREGSDDALYSFFTEINENMMTRLDSNDHMMAEFSGETVVVWGAKDDILTVDQVPVLQRRLNIPDENIHILEDTAHFVAEERPEIIAREVLALLGKGSGQASRRLLDQKPG